MKEIILLTFAVFIGSLIVAILFIVVVDFGDWLFSKLYYKRGK